MLATTGNSNAHGKNGRRASEFGTVAGLGVKNRRPSVLDVRAKREARKALNVFVEGCVAVVESEASGHSDAMPALPGTVRLSFVLENVADAVVAQHRLNSFPPAAALFGWCWNEPEMPKLIALGCWWVASLLTQVPGRTAPLGPAGEVFQIPERAAMANCEDACMRGIARLFCCLSSKQVTACSMGRLSGKVGDQASALVWSQVLPHALALATRDVASLAWPHMAHALSSKPSQPPSEAADSSKSSTHDAAGLWLIAVWSFLLTGEQADHVMVRNVEASAVPKWPQPSDLAPARLHRRQLSAALPPAFPALARQQELDQAVKRRVQSVLEENRLNAMPKEERDAARQAANAGPSTDHLGIPLVNHRRNLSTAPAATSSSFSSRGSPRMLQRKVALGRSPLYELTTSRHLAPLASDGTPRMPTSPLRAAPSLQMALNRRSNSRGSPVSRSSIQEQQQQQRQQQPSTLTQDIPSNPHHPGSDERPRSRALSYEAALTMTYAPPVHDSSGFLLQLATPVQTDPDAPAPPPWPSLFTELVMRRNSSRPLGSGAPHELRTPAVRSPHAPAALLPTRRQRHRWRTAQEQQQLEASTRARDEKVHAFLGSQVVALQAHATLSRALDREDAARRTARNVVAAHPGPVPRALVARMVEYHRERGVLPRHFSLRPESFR